MRATLRAIRVNRRISIEDAAKKIGIPVSLLRKYEKCEESPYLDDVFKIMKVYNIESINQIIFDNKSVEIRKMQEKKQVCRNIEKSGKLNNF